MGVAHHLTSTGGINVTTSYWVENLHLHLVYKSMHEFEWHQSDLLNQWTEKTLKRIKKWQKNTCGRVAFLDMLQAAIFFRKFSCITELIFRENFADTFKYMHFLCDAIELKQSVEVTLKV